MQRKQNNAESTILRSVVRKALLSATATDIFIRHVSNCSMCAFIM